MVASLAFHSSLNCSILNHDTICVSATCIFGLTKPWCIWNLQIMAHNRSLGEEKLIWSKLLYWIIVVYLYVSYCFVKWKACTSSEEEDKVGFTSQHVPRGQNCLQLLADQHAAKTLRNVKCSGMYMCSRILCTLLWLNLGSLFAQN